MAQDGLDEHQLRRLIAVGRSLVSELDSEAVLEQVLDAARELTGARYAALGILDTSGHELERFITLGIGPEDRLRIGDLPRGRGVLGQLIVHPEPLRLANVADHPHSYGFPPNHPPMTTFLGVPIRIGGEVFGNLYLTEKAGGIEFTATDEQSAIVLAEWAAIAIGNARSIAVDRFRHSIMATERERTRWAHELHDDTLQGIGALRMLLSSAVRRGEPEHLARVAEEVVGRLGDEIQKLRGLIVELRPAALDQLGLQAAVESLADRYEVTAGLEIRREVDLSYERGEEPDRLDPDIEATTYRVVQESLTNIAKHARAERVAISLQERAGCLELEVRDDGVGFDPADGHGRGFGLDGMRERLSLAGGSLVVESAPGTGTRVSATIPAVRAGEGADRGYAPADGGP